MEFAASKNYIPGIISLIGILVTGGCTEPDPNLNICDVTEHQWYVDVVESAENSGLHKRSTIYRYDYEDSYFFEVENMLFSCMYCYIYNCDGNLAEFSESAGIDDFIEHRTDRVRIWAGDATP